ncbi:MAG: hypothetical protein AVDCRST_MAG54-384, partial [uncultured Actinomycetospora sp.]
ASRRGGVASHSLPAQRLGCRRRSGRDASWWVGPAQSYGGATGGGLDAGALGELAHQGDPTAAV